MQGFSISDLKIPSENELKNIQAMSNFLIPEIETPSEERFYNDLKSSPNNFSYWFPKIEKCGIPVPESIIIPVPIPVMKSFFFEEDGDKERVRAFVRDSLLPAIPESFGNRVFVKNGCFSNKFDFKHCSPERTEDALYEAVSHIQYDSFCFDTGGNTEIVVRKFIGGSDDSFKDTIYEGMRLRPEIRVFHDFDSGRSLYAANYWDWDYCHEAISRHESDKAVYEKAYPTLESVFGAHKDQALELVQSKMKGVDLKGVWSADLMYAEGRWWLIDMALGHMSAYWNPELVKSLLQSASPV